MMAKMDPKPSILYVMKELQKVQSEKGKTAHAIQKPEAEATKEAKKIEKKQWLTH